MTDRKQNQTKKSSGRGRRPGRGTRRQARKQEMKGAGPTATIPVAFTKVVTVAKPKMETRRNGDAHIRHREYIGDISAGLGSPSAFDLTPYAINPGQAATFPWLSKIAANYESYSFKKLHFVYETQAPTSLGGSLFLAIDYDARDNAPTDKVSAMQYDSSVRSAPWKSCTHVSSAKNLSKSKTFYIRPGAQPSNTDIKTYDVGNLYVMSQGVTTSGATLGELYVEYDVELMTPVYETVPAQLVGGSVASGGVLTPANPLGTLPALDVDSYGVGVDAKSVLTCNQSGTYMFTFFVTGTDLTSLDVKSDGIEVLPLAFGEVSSGILIGYCVYSGNTGFDVSLGATATTVTEGRAYISRMPSGSAA